MFYLVNNQNIDFVHIFNLFGWIMQAIFCLPMVFLLKYEANVLRDDAALEKDKSKANYKRFLSFTATSSVLFFAWLFMHSVINADNSRTTILGTQNDLAPTLITINNYIGALLAITNFSNFVYITYKAYRFAMDAKKQKNQEGYKTFLASAIFETSIILIYLTLFTIWFISLFSNSPLSAAGHTLDHHHIAYLLLAVALLCFFCIFIAIYIISLKIKTIQTTNKDKTLKRRKLFETAQFINLNCIVLALGFIAITAFVIEK